MKIVKLLVILITACLLFSGCDWIKGDDDDENFNYVEYDGIKYELTKGVLAKKSESDTSFNFKLILLTSDMQVVDDTLESGNYSISGTGLMLRFNLYSSQSENIPKDIYSYSSDTKLKKTSTFDELQIKTLYESDNGSGSNYAFFHSGFLKVLSADEVYKNYEFVFVNEDVFFHYDGVLNFYDQTVNNASVE